MKPRFFKTAADLRAWFEKHHDGADELLIGFYKKTSGRPSVTYPEALDQALAFGWIDGIRRRLDEEAYTIRFTPRRPGSIWSRVNVKRAEELVAARQMHTSGLRLFRERDPEKTAGYVRPEPRTLDASLATALQANRKAAAFFEAQPPGYRNLMIGWIMNAKKEETRARRFANLIAHSEKGTRIDLMNPNR
ncbi:MAG TPA: YdeI/OmpD-associated family protein [Bryobacteraceae bacterium]